jgi:hypothetical protein
VSDEWRARLDHALDEFDHLPSRVIGEGLLDAMAAALADPSLVQPRAALYAFGRILLRHEFEESHPWSA